VSFPTAGFAFVENRLPHSLNRPSSGFGFKRVSGFPLGVFEGAAIDRVVDPRVVTCATDAGRFGSTDDCAYLAKRSQECTLI